jgi:hypothetical protein
MLFVPCLLQAGLPFFATRYKALRALLGFAVILFNS